MEKIGIGQLGYGGIGKIHTYCYRQLPLLYPGKLPEIVLEGVRTSSPETAARAARAGGFRRGFSDLGELLQQEEEVDVVDCCLPNFLHKEALIRAFEAGKHVYCEKPLSVNSEDTMDDAAWLEVRMREGGIGTIEVSRFATGALDDLNIEIYGEKAAMMFRLMDANWLYWYDAAQPGGSMGGERGWTRLETVQHYPGATLPPPRSIVGWTRTHAENQYAFLEAVSRGETAHPGSLDGLRCQLIMDAAYRSTETGSWVEVPPE